MLTTLLKLFCFILCICILYFVVPKKGQWYVILLGNISFCAYVSRNGLPFVFGTIFITYFAAILLEKLSKKSKEASSSISDREEKKKIRAKFTRKKRWVLGLALVLIFGLWGSIKYSGWLMPLGISYYTLIAAGYCIDVYRDKYGAEHNFLKYTTFVTFFMQMIQGPFSRYGELSKTLFGSHSFSFTRLYDGLMRILWGVFKKCMVADKLSVTVDYIYQNYQNLNGIYVMLGIVFFAIELYADFSGYMDIMLGAGNIMGIVLPENFHQPFFSKSIEEFWRRWHITLGAWFKDYVFYPVSMSKWCQNLGRSARKLLGNQMGRLLPSYLALIFVWSATGLWHGAALHFWLWGMMQMIVIIFSMQMAPVYEKLHTKLHISVDSSWWKGIQMIRTFLLFGFMEVMSEADTIGMAFSMYGRLFTRWDFSIFSDIHGIFVQMQLQDVMVCLIGIAMMILVDVLREKKISIKNIIQRIPVFPRYVLYIGAIYMIIIFATRGQGMGGFMYANF